jgi:hypothetical protein
MTKYVQTNSAGYVTGIVEEPLLVGLFGGNQTRTLELSNEQAQAVEALLKGEHSRGEGLHVSKLECLRQDAPKRR